MLSLSRACPPSMTPSISQILQISNIESLLLENFRRMSLLFRGWIKSCEEILL